MIIEQYNKQVKLEFTYAAIVFLILYQFYQLNVKQWSLSVGIYVDTNTPYIPSKDNWQCLKTFFIFTIGKGCYQCLRKPKMLLNITGKDYPVQKTKSGHI